MIVNENSKVNESSNYRTLRDIQQQNSRRLLLIMRFDLQTIHLHAFRRKSRSAIFTHFIN